MMNWDPRPTPEITPETERYWEAAAEEKLLICKCETCELNFFYPRGICPDCFGDDVIWREASGKGTVYTYSTAHTMSGWPSEHLPLVVAYVELDEGPRILTNIEGEPDNIEVGTRVQVRFRPIDDEDAAVPVFVPLED